MSKFLSAPPPSPLILKDENSIPNCPPSSPAVINTNEGSNKETIFDLIKKNNEETSFLKPLKLVRQTNNEIDVDVNGPPPPQPILRKEDNYYSEPL
jgi:hypothetical protein